MKPATKYSSIDLFSGCGGLTLGLHKAGFHTELAIDSDYYACKTYKMNFRNTILIEQDIRTVSTDKIKENLSVQTIHLLAGCPPCQGFSSLRRLNKRQNVRDARNNLVLEYLRFVKELMPYTIMMENVPGLANYYQFRNMVTELKNIGYHIVFKVLNVKHYGVPQNRERLVLIGSRLGKIDIPSGIGKYITVKQRIGNLASPEISNDPLQKIVANHTDRIKAMIALIPKDGGGRKELPDEYILECHKKEGIGFNDIYGRLRWNDQSTTITGGCLNPSKGRFLHPEQDRVITPREAAMLQSFPKNYKFPIQIPKAALALLIGNALPPAFSYNISKHIKKHLDEYLGR